MRRVCHTLLVGALLIASGLPQSSGKFDTEAALKHVQVLASPEMEGRKSGTPGARKAALYIAEQFRAAGLEPLGDRDTFLQQYTFPSFQFTGPCGLWVLDAGKEHALHYGDEFYVLNNSGAGEFQGEVIFVGYGISARERSYDDYAGVDVNNKVVLAMEGAPGNPGNWPATLRASYAKAQEASRRGARALLLFPDPDKGRQLPEQRVWVFSKARSTSNLLTAKIDAPVADRLLEGSGWSAGQLKKAISSTLKPHSFLTGKQIRLRADVRIVDETPAWNVLGVVRGTSKSLSDEMIVVGGHYDAGGVDPDGVLYPGAEDDASGTALAIEIARSLTRSGARPLRSIVFGAWAAEEQGFSGHEYFLKHSPFPLDRCAAAFWLDNAGLGDGTFHAYGAYFFPGFYNYLALQLSGELRAQLQPGGIGASGFQEIGIPSLFTHATGPHAYNHTRYDLPRLIRREALQSIGDFVCASVRAIATTETLPYSRPDVDGYWLRSSIVATASIHELRQLGAWGGHDEPSHVDERKLPELVMISVDASGVDLESVSAAKRRLTDLEIGTVTDFTRITAGARPSVTLVLENATTNVLRGWWDLGARAIALSARANRDFIDEAGKVGFTFFLRNPAALQSARVSDAIVIVPVQQISLGAELPAQVLSRGACLALEFAAQPEGGGSSSSSLLLAVLERLGEARKQIPNDRIVLAPSYSESGEKVCLSDLVSHLRRQGHTRTEVAELLGGNLLRILKARAGP